MSVTNFLCPRWTNAPSSAHSMDECGNPEYPILDLLGRIQGRELHSQPSSMMRLASLPIFPTKIFCSP